MAIPARRVSDTHTYLCCVSGANGVQQFEKTADGFSIDAPQLFYVVCGWKKTTLYMRWTKEEETDKKRRSAVAVPIGGRSTEERSKTNPARERHGFKMHAAII